MTGLGITAAEGARWWSRAASYVRLNARFYLGLGAPCTRRAFPEARVRSALGVPPDLIRDLVACYQRGSEQVERINFRCARITAGQPGRSVFVKEFPRLRRVHDVERGLRCSRVDRAWRAGHLLPRMGILTPRPMGTAQAGALDGTVTEYLVTEWLQSARPFPELLSAASGGRAALLGELAGHMRRWHHLGIYLRDLVKNVLVTGEEGERRYWLTDLDGLHPMRWPNRDRVLFHMRQLAHWAKPSPEEAQLVADAYLSSAPPSAAAAIRSALIAD